MKETYYLGTITPPATTIAWSDIESTYNGVRILKVEGFLKKGQPVNIYNEQWIEGQSEDFLVAGSNGIVRKNADIDITFAIRQKYAHAVNNSVPDIDLLALHETFISAITGGDIYIKSSYYDNKYVHCICLKEYEPTQIRLHRSMYEGGSKIWDESYITGTVTLHMLDIVHDTPTPTPST